MKRPYIIRIYEMEYGVWRWRITAPNGRITNHDFNSRSGARKSLLSFLAAIEEGNYCIDGDEK